jgi:hypothetical protein
MNFLSEVKMEGGDGTTPLEADQAEAHGEAGEEGAEEEWADGDTYQSSNFDEEHSHMETAALEEKQAALEKQLKELAQSEMSWAEQQAELEEKQADLTRLRDDIKMSKVIASDELHRVKDWGALS